MIKKLATSELANLSQVMACIMVIISLIYAITEYNQQRLIDTSEIDSALYLSSEELNLRIASDPILASLIMRAEKNTDTLNEVERFQYTRLRLNDFNNWEKAFDYHNEKRMSDSNWKLWNDAYSVNAKQMPDFAWEDNKEFFLSSTPGFIDLVDQAIYEN